MNEKQIFNKAYAPALLCYIKAYNNAPLGSHLKSTLKKAMRNSLEQWSHRTPELVSQEAEKLSKKHHVDLFKTRYSGRGKCLKKYYLNKKGKKIECLNLVWEHTTPLKKLIESLCKYDNIKAIKDTLNSYSGVCWITRKEDNKLTRKGYKNNRLGGWRKCYKKCGIIIKRKP